MEQRPRFPQLPDFVPRAPWWGGDLQTLRNILFRPRPLSGAVSSERLRFAMPDGSGDVLSAMRDRAPRPAQLPLVVLVHGLTGCEDSAYMLASARACLVAGADVIRLNLRGAGPSRAQCRAQYHAGRTADLRAVLGALETGRGEFFLVGYSLGGNMMLKFLAEHGDGFPIAGAVSVSAPIDLAAASARMMARRNALYHRWLLARMKEESLAGAASIGAAERRAVERARTVYDFDDRFVAPRNGFAGADDYYARNAARGFLKRITTPSLLIHAGDDPWIPAAAYREVEAGLPPSTKLLLSPRGGHVGFHGQGRGMAWHDRWITAMLSQPDLSRRATSTAA